MGFHRRFTQSYFPQWGELPPSLEYLTTELLETLTRFQSICRSTWMGLRKIVWTIRLWFDCMKKTGPGCTDDRQLQL